MEWQPQKQIDLLMQLVKSLQGEISSKNNEIAAMSSQFNSMSSQYDVLFQDNSFLHAQLIKEKNKAAKLNQLLQSHPAVPTPTAPPRLSHFRSPSSQHLPYIDQLQKIAEERQAIIQSITKDVYTLSIEKQSLLHNLSTLTQQKQSLMQSNQSLLQQKQTLTQQKQASQLNHELLLQQKQILLHKIDQATLQKQQITNTLQRINNELEEERNGLITQQKALQLHLHECKMQIQELQSKCNVENANTHSHAHDMMRNDNQLQIESKISENEEHLHTKINQLEAVLKSKELTIKQLSEFLEEMISKNKKQGDELGRREDEQHRLSNEMHAIINQQNEQAQLADALKQLKQAKDVLRMREGEIQSLRAQLKQAESSLLLKQKSLEYFSEFVNDQSLKINDQSLKINALSQQLDNQSRNMQLQRKGDSQPKDQTAKQTAKQPARDYQNLNRQLQELSAENHSLKDMLSNILIVNNNRQFQADMQLKIQQEIAQRVEGQTMNLKQQNERLQQINSNLLLELNQIKQAADAQIADLQDKCNTLTNLLIAKDNENQKQKQKENQKQKVEELPPSIQLNTLQSQTVNINFEPEPPLEEFRQSAPSYERQIEDLLKSDNGKSPLQLKQYEIDKYKQQIEKNRQELEKNRQEIDNSLGQIQKLHQLNREKQSIINSLHSQTSELKAEMHRVKQEKLQKQMELVLKLRQIDLLSERCFRFQQKVKQSMNMNMQNMHNMHNMRHSPNSNMNPISTNRMPLIQEEEQKERRVENENEPYEDRDNTPTRLRSQNEELLQQLMEKEEIVCELQDRLMRIESHHGNEMLILMKENAELNNELIALKKKIYMLNPDAIDISLFLKQCTGGNGAGTGGNLPGNSPNSTGMGQQRKQSLAKMSSSGNHYSNTYIYNFNPHALPTAVFHNHNQNSSGLQNNSFSQLASADRWVDYSQFNLGEKFMGRKCKRMSRQLSKSDRVELQSQSNSHYQYNAELMQPQTRTPPRIYQQQLSK